MRGGMSERSGKSAGAAELGPTEWARRFPSCRNQYGVPAFPGAVPSSFLVLFVWHGSGSKTKARGCVTRLSQRDGDREHSHTSAQSAMRRSRGWRRAGCAYHGKTDPGLLNAALGTSWRGSASSARPGCVELFVSKGFELHVCVKKVRS